MTSNPPRFRFAPSPNGELHLGHAFSALKTWQLAARVGGEVLLRIEDIDTGRTRERYVDGIYEDLAWLGLSWPEPVRRQSEHFDDYRAATARLQSAGLLYSCSATRKQIAAIVADHIDWPMDPDGAPLYPGRNHIAARDTIDDSVANGEPGSGTALRLDMNRAIDQVGDRTALIVATFDEAGKLTEREVNASAWGDTVIVRKDTPTSYHLSVVVDDALQGITHVTRGRDLEAATSLHVLLQQVLGYSSPVYHHHDLVTDSAGRKLSKSLRDTSLRHLREAGWSIADVYSAIGMEKIVI